MQPSPFLDSIFSSPEQIDLDALKRRADPARLPAPKPLTRLSAGPLLQAQASIMAQEERVCSGGQQMTSSVLVGGPAKAFSSGTLESLAPVSLVGSGLRTDETARGEHLIVTASVHRA